LCSAIRDLGYEYVNVDLQPTGRGLRVEGDAQRLPFSSGSFNLIVSSDTLEHFSQPATVLAEVHRILKDEGRLIVWVPFLHPFHGDDYFRYTPLGLQSLVEGANLRMVSLEAPLALFSLFAQAWIVLLRRMRLGFVEPWLERVAAWLDHKLRRFQRGMSFAAAYLLVACKPSVRGQGDKRDAVDTRATSL
jgi:ubiquinone/menaquinone biosynthesis C-methylase UbiE